MTTPPGPEGLPFGNPPGGQFPPIPPELTVALQLEAARRLNEAAAAGQASAEPLSALDGFCITLRVWFEGLTRAGFSDAQAMYYLALKT